MKIRPATPSDADTITAIYDTAVRTGTASFELEPPGTAEMARRIATVLEAGYPYLIAEDDGVLGYAYANAFRPRPAYFRTVEDSIYVAPGAQGRGVGRALLSRLILLCEEKGFRQMVAVIGDSANTPSITLHRVLGFEDAGLLKSTGLKFGRWIDTVLMQRPLGAGDADLPEG